MTGNWEDDLNPDERVEWDRFVNRVRREIVEGINSSVMPGAAVPERLRRVADEIVEADLSFEAGRIAVSAALERMGVT